MSMKQMKTKIEGHTFRYFYQLFLNVKDICIEIVRNNFVLKQENYIFHVNFWLKIFFNEPLACVTFSLN